MRRAARMLAACALAVLAAGCGPKPGTPRAQPVPVRVTNHNRADVVVYLVRGGNTLRLGTVVTGETRVLPIRNVPIQQLQGVQFDVRRIGVESAPFRTRAVSLGPEQMVTLTIEDLLTTSQISVAENPAPEKMRP
ncbi:MAG TPA: hypothetical protein VFJ16_05025 [Longimicrobium sp.]|nr:hypothetical protein [Longimicrobium sp.]